MLKPEKKKVELPTQPKKKVEGTIPEQLRAKSREIVITNICNLNCGGCCQLIGHFRKDQLWFITLEELEREIRILERHPPKLGATPITIFGGEPTLHPQWDEIVAMLRRHAPTVFWINTNGRLGHQRYQKDGNLVWWVDLHPDNQMFVQTLYAAADAVKLPNDMAYWEKAQKDCPIWNGCQCSIYNGKAYFCENAAALDWLYHDGEHGWKVEPGKNPFDRTKEEIDEQAKHACKRCGWCVTELVPRQFSKDPSYVSPMNQVEGKKTRHSLAVVEPIFTQRWVKDEDLQVEVKPDIAVYCIADNDLSKWATVYKANKKSLREGRSKHDWTIVLGPNQVIPKNAMATLVNWICQERERGMPRLHVSMPVYELPHNRYKPDMLEPMCFAKSCVVGFHKNSKEVLDEGIFHRLGHRKPTEGSGIASLWHDKLTDIVGGVITLY